MLVKNLFSIVLIASSVFAAPPAASDNKTPVQNDGVSPIIKNSIGQLMNDPDAKTNMKSFLNNPHIHACAMFIKQECVNWIHSIQEDEKKIAIVKKIVNVFKSVVKNESAVLKKVQEVQSQDKSSNLTAELGRRDEDLSGPIDIILNLGKAVTIVLLGLTALFITTVGSVVGVVPAAAVTAIVVGIFGFFITS